MGNIELADMSLPRSSDTEIDRARKFQTDRMWLEAAGSLSVDNDRLEKKVESFLLSHNLNS